MRAKVAALRAGQTAEAATRSAALADVARYLRLARQLAEPPHPWLALTLGVSGSGKSSQTQPLIEQRGLVRLRADVERKRLFGLAPEDPSTGVPGGIYAEATSDRLFAGLLATARELLADGWPVLVDATFIRLERRAPFAALAAELRVPWCVLAFEAPPALLRERVAQRQAQGGDASEAGLAVLESQLAHAEPLNAEEAARAVRIDARQAPDWPRLLASWPPPIGPAPEDS